MIERFDVEATSDNYCYRVFADEHRRRYALAADALRDEGLLPEHVVLDAAFGMGYGYPYLRNWRYIGLDVWPDAVREAGSRYPGGDFRWGDLDRFDLSFFRPSAIVSLETAEHLAHPRYFLKACRLALSPRNGILIFSAPTCLTRDYDPYHRRDWSAAKWRDALRRAGFVIRSETPMPFTTHIGEFFRTVPTTRRQKLRVAAFNLLHPRYLIDRLWNWGIRQEFQWESTLFVCHSSPSGAGAA